MLAAKFDQIHVRFVRRNGIEDRQRLMRSRVPQGVRLMRMTIGCLVGIAAAVIVVFAGEAIGHAMFPPPAGIDLSDPKALAILISQLPTGAIVAVLLSWAAGAFVGGGLAARITRKQWTAWLVGLSMLAAGFVTMLAIPHPTWFAIAAVPAALAPAWLAGWLFSRFA